jgi:hypothetical protein
MILETCDQLGRDRGSSDDHEWRCLIHDPENIISGRQMTSSIQSIDAILFDISMQSDTHIIHDMAVLLATL